MLDSSNASSESLGNDLGYKYVAERGQRQYGHTTNVTFPLRKNSQQIFNVLTCSAGYVPPTSCLSSAL